MQINNITYCRKPRRFTGLKETGKVRYKHYEQMPDEMLSAYSTIKAYSEVKNSTKAKLLNSMPAITGILIGTSLAITQPGKLATKVGTGLGFLALSGAVSALSDGFSKIIDKAQTKLAPEKRNTKKAQNLKMFAVLGSTFAVAGSALALLKNRGKILNLNNPVAKFLSGEKDKLISELNSSRLGKKVEEKFIPFSQKHSKAFSLSGYFAPLGVILGTSVAGVKLEDSLSNDISKLALQKYIKGKAAQQDARAHFNSIDAVEV